MNDKNNLFLLKPLMLEKFIKTNCPLKNNKGSLSYIIPIKALKMFSGSLLPYLTLGINNSIATCLFFNEKICIISA